MATKSLQRIVRLASLRWPQSSLRRPRWQDSTRADTPVASKTRAYVTALASDKLEGRLTGNECERLARDYLIGELQRMAHDQCRGQAISPVVRIYRRHSRMAARSRDWSIPKRKRRGNLTSSKRFARCLLRQRRCERRRGVCRLRDRCARSAELRVRQLRHAQCKRQVVLVLRYFPEDADEKTKGILARYADLRYKAMAARQRGAKAIARGRRTDLAQRGETIPMSFDTAIAGSGIVAASISGASQMPCSTRSAIRQKRWVRHRSYRRRQSHATGIRTARYRSQRATEVVREKRTATTCSRISRHGAHRGVAAMGCGRRALRSPGARRERQLTGRINRRRARSRGVPTTMFRQCCRTRGRRCASARVSSA